MISVIARFFSRQIIPIILLISIWTCANLKWSGNFWKYTVTSDGKGYYAYLPATFIYHDLNLGFYDSIEAKYYDEHTKYDFRASSPNGKTIDKYFCGPAIMQMPFFLTGHLAALISGEPADGYSKPYMVLVGFGAVFWLAIGLIYLRKFLSLHGASEGQSAFILAAIYFGTNLNYYTVQEPMMSHLYSFALVSIFLFHSKKWIGGNLHSGWIAAFVLGMIALTRPVNLLIGFWLVFEAGGFLSLFRKKMEALKNIRYTLILVLLFLFPVSIQLLIYKLQTGSFLQYSYGEEGFRFAHPEMINFLFSYKKGLFVYLPITLLALTGLIPLWKKDRFRAVFAFAFFLFVTYVLSSWWMWYYGGSFGTRVMVEYLPFFALLLFYLLDGIKQPAFRTIVISLMILLVVFCQLQMYQYRYEIIHWSEMTEERYWDVFLQLKK